MLQRIIRPRVLVYSAILTLLVVSLLASLWHRTPFRVNVIRDRGVMARLTDDGMLENIYRLLIMYGTEKTQQYRLNVSGIKYLEIETETANENLNNKDKELSYAITVKPAESRWLIVDLKIPDGSLKSGSHKIQFEIQAIESKQIVTVKSIFLVPR